LVSSIKPLKFFETLPVNQVGMFVPGKIGQAIDVDNQEFVRVPDNDNLDFGTDSFSIMFWTKFSSADQENKAKWAEKKGSARGWYIKNLGGKPHFFIQDQFGNKEHTTFLAASGNDKWHHITIVVDRDSIPPQVRVYKDGTQRNMVGQLPFLDISSIAGTVSNGRDLTIGGTGSVSKNFNGLIDDTKFHNRVVSDQEILNAAQG